MDVGKQIEALVSVSCWIQVVEVVGGYELLALRVPDDPSSHFAWIPLARHPATYNLREIAADIEEQASHGELEVG